MFDFDSSAPATPIYWIDKPYWLGEETPLSAAQLAFGKAQGFKALEGQTCFLPDEKGNLAAVLFGGGTGGELTLKALEALPKRLPAGLYTLLINGETPLALAQIAHIWADGCYQFDRYKKVKPIAAKLRLPDSLAYLTEETKTVQTLRDWVNTPAEDMNPASFSDLIEQTAHKFGAHFDAIVGEDLLTENYPMIHAVGRAGQHAPRYCELSWNADKTELPLVALVGKGVCFDTGGLNIKTGNFMRLMKKDMGGAAHALALAHLIMAANLPVRLHLGIPLVENNIAANAFRPSDVFPTRKGIMVEIDNTDAEGRLVLADGLARACEKTPDLLLDFATLTGAARVALGPDLAPIFTDDRALAAAIVAQGEAVGDPMWPMPLWAPYKRYLRSSVADMQNSGGRMAGAITAGLFMQAFVTPSIVWAHFDVWAWREAQNGQAEGGYPCGIRAVWGYLQDRFADKSDA